MRIVRNGEGKRRIILTEAERRKIRLAGEVLQDLADLGVPQALESSRACVQMLGDAEKGELGEA